MNYPIMYGVNVVLNINKSLLSRVKNITCSLKHIQRNASKIKTSLSRFQIENDVVLFKFENPAFFYAINFFSAVQFMIWNYTGIYFLKSINNIDIKHDNSVWSKILEKEREYNTHLRILAVVFGWCSVVATSLYSFRSIRKIILHKGGKYVTLVTYNLPGYDTIKVPLQNISAFQHRLKVKKFIPIKVRNKYLFYLIDIDGEFTNPSLFDFTAGVKREV